MKKCLLCDAIFISSTNRCSSCEQTEKTIDSFTTYAPDFTQKDQGFKSHYFSDLVEFEANNFWFRARNNLITWAIRQYSPNFHTLLEIGCGTGFALLGIFKAFPETNLTGSELFIQGLKFAANRVPTANLIQMDARNIPYVNEFDIVGTFDVLEHIKEDEQVLNQIYQALKPNGIVILTVPQHKWLWSPVDDYACHMRRYSAKELHEKIGKAGFKILRSTSFVTSLLPAMFISRFIQRLLSIGGKQAQAELNISPRLNKILEHILNTEICLIGSGINLPIGGSRLTIAQKL